MASLELKIYLCDRAKNNECNKRGCVDNGGECYYTLSKEYAQCNYKDEPIVAFRSERRCLELTFETDDDVNEK